MFSRFLVVPVQEITCEVPAQSVTHRALISIGAYAVKVICGLSLSVPPPSDT